MRQKCHKCQHHKPSLKKKIQTKKMFNFNRKSRTFKLCQRYWATNGLHSRWWGALGGVRVVGKPCPGGTAPALRPRNSTATLCAAPQPRLLSSPHRRHDRSARAQASRPTPPPNFFGCLRLLGRWKVRSEAGSRFPPTWSLVCATRRMWPWNAKKDARRPFQRRFKRREKKRRKVRRYGMEIHSN